MPLLASVVVVSLGIGIGVNVVVFSWLQAVVLQPLPGVAHARQLVFVEPRSEAGTHPGVSWQEYEDLRDRLRTFDSLIAFRMVPFNVGEPSRNERIYGQLVSGNYFSGLGLTPSAGRFFRADEVSRSANDFVMVVSHGLALSRFGSPAAAIGQSLRVNDRDVTIVGVAPEHFQGTVLGLDFSMWVPATLAPSLLAGSRELDSREVRGYAALGRLAGGATQAQAQARSRERDAGAGPALSREQRRHGRPGDVVLGGAARPAVDDHRCARCPAGHHAAGAPRGVRQHREPDAGAGEHAPA